MSQHQTIKKQFWKYTFPTVMAMLVNGLYQIVDGIFIGHYMGSDGLAGINVAWPVVGAILGLGMLVGVGTGALVSIKAGEGQPTAAKEILTSGLLLLLLLAPCVSIVLWLWKDHFLLWQGVSGHVFEFGAQYLQILVISNSMTLGSIALPFFLRNDNSPNLATWLMVIGAVANIAFDYLFIAHLHWQLEGAAIATGISQLIVTLLGIGYFFSPWASMKLRLNDFVMQWRVVPTIFAIGASSFFMYAYGSTMVALHNNLFSHYGNAIYIAAYAIIGYIVTIYYLVSEGIANGMQPLVSYHYGAKNPQNIKILLSIAMKSVVCSGICFIVLLNCFPEAVISAFNNNEPELVATAVTGIRYHMFALFLDGFLVVAAAYYQSINHGRKAMFVTIGNMLIQLPFLYILPKVWGITGVWLAYPLSNIALSIVVIWMLWRDMKKLNQASVTVVTA